VRVWGEPASPDRQPEPGWDPAALGRSSDPGTPVDTPGEMRWGLSVLGPDPNPKNEPQPKK